MCNGTRVKIKNNLHGLLFHLFVGYLALMQNDFTKVWVFNFFAYVHKITRFLLDLFFLTIRQKITHCI